LDSGTYVLGRARIGATNLTTSETTKTPKPTAISGPEFKAQPISKIKMPTRFAAIVRIHQARTDEEAIRHILTPILEPTE
jgi:hypothetical protein